MENLGTVSIVLPVFNREKMIATAIHSVLEQTYSDFELLVVNDGSTDSTAQIVEQFEDKRIRLIRLKENRGVAFARNRAFDAAKGQWIAFLDSDDAWLPQRLERLLGILGQSTGNTMVADIPMRCYRVGSQIVPWRSWCNSSDARLIGKEKILELREYLALSFAGAIKPIIPRRAIAEQQLQQTETLHFAEDFEFFIRILKRETMLKMINESMYQYCHSPSSLVLNPDRNALVIAMFQELQEKEDFSIYEREQIEKRINLYKAREQTDLIIRLLESRHYFKALYEFMVKPWLWPHGIREAFNKCLRTLYFAYLKRKVSILAMFQTGAFKDSQQKKI